MQRYYTVFDATEKPAKLGFGLRSDEITLDEDADNDPVPDDPDVDPEPTPVPELPKER